MLAVLYVKTAQTEPCMTFQYDHTGGGYYSNSFPQLNPGTGLRPADLTVL